MGMTHTQTTGSIVLTTNSLGTTATLDLGVKNLRWGFPTNYMKFDLTLRTLPTYKAETEGNIIALWERSDSEQVMSDVWDYATNQYALVWFPKEQAAKVIVIQYAYKDANTGYGTPYQVDATPEVMAAFEKWYQTTARPYLAKEQAQSTANGYIKGIEQNIAIAQRINKGDIVTVARGRKFPIGLTGKLFWIGESQWGVKGGVALSDRKDAKGRNLDVMWIALNNLDKAKTPENTKLLNELIAKREANNAKAQEGGEFYKASYEWAKDWRETMAVG